ncbi:DUF6503 family protein [Formosa haliotis]|uniref:DUF6503 family protein n=1 Tax=Formosa haliotis TaxID=1555194 RepID=UPI0008266A06|nr:DUF6503 family protein [Formosa haliotis]
MKIKVLVVAMLSLFIWSCKNDKQAAPKKETPVETTQASTPEFKNNAHELVYNMVQHVGNYKKLREKKDVIYTYTYKTPDGKTDISKEKYIFSGELSYGAYKKHERTLPQLEGLIEQGYDGQEFWLKHNGTIVNDDALLKAVAFNRPTNFYWFTMMPKLLDEGVIYEYIGEKTIDDIKYDIVKITFESEDNTPKDIYQIYINKETTLVDQFLFTVVDFNKMDPLLMKMEYENIDGLLIPTKRKYKASNWDAEVSNDPWIHVNWTDIKFNNNLTEADFKK